MQVSFADIIALLFRVLTCQIPATIKGLIDGQIKVGMLQHAKLGSPFGGCF